MSTTVVPTQVAIYLAAVREALGDLGPDERDDLLVEVEASLIETAGEDDRPIAARLGPPEDFAAELRASAGLPPAASARPSDPGLVGAVRTAVAEARTHPRVRSAERVLGELAPIWWLVRGYVAFVLVARLLGAGWSYDDPAFPRIGRGGSGAGVLTAVVLGAAVAGSIAVGLRGRRRGRPASRAVAVANVILAVAAVPAVAHLTHARSDQFPVYVTPAGLGVPTPPTAPSPKAAAVAPGLLRDGKPVVNIYPYSRDGRLLHDVILFDQNGAPLDVLPGVVDPTRRVLTGPGGQRIFDSFPIRYFEPGTTRVAQPNGAPKLAGPSPFTRPAARTPSRPVAPRRARH